MFDTRLVKAEREKLGFNQNVRKAKQPATGSYLYLNLKLAILPPIISEWDSGLTYNPF